MNKEKENLADLINLKVKEVAAVQFKLDEAGKEINRLREVSISRLVTIMDMEPNLKQIMQLVRKGHPIRERADKDKQTLVDLGLIRNYNDIEAHFTEDGKVVALRIN